MKTNEELNGMSKEQLMELGTEELATCVSTLLAENKCVKERADSYYKWYNDQCAATCAVQKKLDSLKALVAVL